MNCPTVGQCFDIEVARDAGGWMIRIPEIGGLVRVGRRAEVDVAARQCIANRTGIPIGYVSVFVARETACTT
ncbi:long chain fatty acid-CoA synthetase Faa4p [Mycobacterium interjectum]|nr:long chain fatty acid-CoA synthetase Faa4p [Mycobacterium interjectum]